MDGSNVPSPRVKAALSRSGLVALGVGLLVLVAIVASSVWQATRNADALQRMDATVADGSLLHDILLAVEDCETGQRGYLLTGRPNYLEPFYHGKAALPDLLETLQQHLGADPAALTLRQTIEAKVAEMGETIRLTQASDRIGAMAIVMTDSGRQQMGEIRTLTASLTAAQQADMARQATAIRRGGRLLVAIDAVGLVVVVAIAVIIGLGLHAYLRELAQARAAAAAAYAAMARNNERLDEMVRIRTADLQLANDEIQRFAYIVSHDLRSPLVNIMGFTSELEQATHTLTNLAEAPGWPAPARVAATEDIPEALRFIKASTSKMDRLINAILKLSRDGRRTLTAERLEMGPLIEDMVATMRHQAKAREVEVTVGPMPVLWADRIAVEQIFGNVIDNALKYLKPDRPGRIQITAETDEVRARFVVADNGRGIAARDFERVFELFRRSGDQSVPGEGIGLAHVRALVRRLGGSIECASTLDVGTSFTITLPLRGSSNQESGA